MGNYGELWFNHGQFLGIMGQFCFIHGELWGNLKNYGELWGIMGNYRTLSIPHTAADVERCNSFYKLNRTDKQHSLKDAHHLGRLSFVMNSVVPPPMGI